ncbi:hypothetical protein GCM10027063_24130 [Promicromonospora xylanilytica]
MAENRVSGLHGWGYEGRTVEDLLDYTREVGAQTVVDVRLNPVSRKRGFSKRILTEHVESAGIGYLHLPALGNPVDNRAGFADPQSDAARAAHHRFNQEVMQKPEAAEALDRISGLLDSGPVVLVCFEADARCCHRSLVINALTEVLVSA